MNNSKNQPPPELELKQVQKTKIDEGILSSKRDFSILNKKLQNLDFESKIELVKWKENLEEIKHNSRERNKRRDDIVNIHY